MIHRGFVPISDRGLVWPEIFTDFDECLAKCNILNSAHVQRGADDYWLIASVDEDYLLWRNFTLRVPAMANDKPYQQLAIPCTEGFRE